MRPGSWTLGEDLADLIAASGSTGRHPTRGLYSLVWWSFWVTAFLTGAMRTKEINFDQLSGKDRQAMQEAMDKEWNAWQNFEATEYIHPSKVPPGCPSVGTPTRTISRSRLVGDIFLSTQRLDWWFRDVRRGST